jgi:hypothetical protein
MLLEGGADVRPRRVVDRARAMSAPPISAAKTSVSGVTRIAMAPYTTGAR